MSFSCEIINPEEEIPSYIHIDKIDLEVKDSLIHCSATHNIVDSWVYVNGELAGVFEMPFTIPLLYAGEQEIMVRAGIKMNGIAGTRVYYPFYTPYVQNIRLYRDSIITINPVVTYKDEVVIPWIEDFEDAGISLDTTPSTQIQIERIDGDNGSKVGYVKFIAGTYVFECISSEAYKLPGAQTYIFLELDYKNTIKFDVGLFANNLVGSQERVPILTVNPKSLWNKIYINLTQQVTIHSDAVDFNIYFRAEKSAEATDEPEIFLDNIKLIHF